jgi:hypothetical protein
MIVKRGNYGFVLLLIISGGFFSLSFLQLTQQRWQLAFNRLVP